MNVKDIDLTKYKGGVTIYFNFKIERNPFFVLITDPTGIATYYYRKFDKEFLRVNLPKHPNKIKVITNGAVIKDYQIKDIEIIHVAYKHNDKLKQTRKYAFNDIREKWVPVLYDTVLGPHGEQIKTPNKNPARIFPSHGLMEKSVIGMAKLAQPAQEYVIDHEKGHYYYGRDIPMNLQKYPRDVQEYYAKRIEEDEMEADRYALHNHINKGYNFSGGLFSLLDNLNDNDVCKRRILNIYNEILKMHKNINE